MSRSHTDVTHQVESRTDSQIDNPACPVTEVLDRVAGKWAIGILVAAAKGPVRFSELERSIEGVSRRMLTLNLRKLEREGLLKRTVYPTVPPKVEYECTEMALELHDTLLSLVDWATRHSHDIARAHADYDAAHSSGQARPQDATVVANGGAPTPR
ncbi:winged helix-turn-helix transcriptional regulator [Streptomyces sp. NPDC014748]|uniref:winged helix-turn-helix transcriptional regulator n=1 Tax=Streptomyces sp. NPDC014748 TaxID=3364905 RepID=UPI003701CB63